MNIPRHVAIIPDGNRRWAKERGLKPWQGHEEGARAGELLIKHAYKKGIRCISFWGSSLENLIKRPFEEKKELLRIYGEYFEKLINDEDVHKNKTRISFFGRWEEQFPASLRKIITRCIKETEQYKESKLNFFLAYSGDDEMLEAVKKIVKSGISYDKIRMETIKENLMTKDLPPVDYLIRTGGEPHLSAGFMMWEIANAELYFSEKYYPDFNEQEFDAALAEYEDRGRRAGK